jgi:hypothetical protein
MFWRPIDRLACAAHFLAELAALFSALAYVSRAHAIGTPLFHRPATLAHLFALGFTRCATFSRIKHGCALRLAYLGKRNIRLRHDRLAGADHQTHP